MGLLEVKFGTQEIGWGRRGWQQIGAFHEALWMFIVDIQYWLDTWNPNLGVLVLENDFLNLDMFRYGNFGMETHFCRPMELCFSELVLSAAQKMRKVMPK